MQPMTVGGKRAEYVTWDNSGQTMCNGPHHNFLHNSVVAYCHNTLAAPETGDGHVLFEVQHLDTLDVKTSANVFFDDSY